MPIQTTQENYRSPFPIPEPGPRCRCRSQGLLRRSNSLIITAGHLAGGGSCSVVVQFAPVAAQSCPGSIALSYDTGGAGTSTFSIPVSGTGTISISINSPTATFSNVPVLTTQITTLQFTNSVHVRRHLLPSTLRRSRRHSPFSLQHVEALWGPGELFCGGRLFADCSWNI